MKTSLLLLLMMITFKVNANCNQKEQSQIALNHCAAEAYADADKELNFIYKKKMNELVKTQKEYPDEVFSKDLVIKFRTAQVAWLKFRDAECDDEAYSASGGSIQPLIEFSCLTALTKARIKQIKSK